MSNNNQDIPHNQEQPNEPNNNDDNSEEERKEAIKYPMFTFSFLLFLAINIAFFILTYKDNDGINKYSLSLWPLMHRSQFYRLISTHFYNYGTIQLIINMEYSYFITSLIESDLGTAYTIIVTIHSVVYVSLTQLFCMFFMKYLFNSNDFNFIQICGFSSVCFCLHMFYCIIANHSPRKVPLFGLYINHHDAIIYLILFYFFLAPYSFLFSHLCGLFSGIIIFNGIGFLTMPSIERVEAFDDIMSNRLTTNVFGYISIDSHKHIRDNIKDFCTFTCICARIRTRTGIQLPEVEENNNNNQV